MNLLFLAWDCSLCFFPAKWFGLAVFQWHSCRSSFYWSSTSRWWFAPLLKTFQYLYMSIWSQKPTKKHQTFSRSRWEVAKVSNLISCLGIGERGGGAFCFLGLMMEDQTSEMNMRYLNLKFLSEHFLWDESNHHKKNINKSHLAEKTIPTISINWSTSGLRLELGWEIEDWSTCQIKGVQAAGFLLPLGTPSMFSRFPVVQGSR